MAGKKAAEQEEGDPGVKPKSDGDRHKGQQDSDILLRSGLADRIGLDNVCPNIDEALSRAREVLASPA